MFKYYLIALIFLLFLIFGMLFILVYFADFFENLNFKNNLNQEKKRNNFFDLMTEQEARLSDLDVLDVYFEGASFRGVTFANDCIIHNYSYIDANAVNAKWMIDDGKIEKLELKIKSDLVKFLDRNFSEKVCPGFTFWDYVEVDASVYRRLIIKRFTAK